ncbi:hypothetical protein PQC44_gp024 [Escherichia phage IME267]|uniref:Uncharacterized protein n=1 Tax=Escherichia phage IME267 TaxID=2860374 RepID=A0AAE8BEM5_9CAUD|nr:hypothetical protein PQC44_gp024 [Escherichia phage IME267]QYC96902.1 hypothetical protein [Escherichia phage IME267]
MQQTSYAYLRSQDPRNQIYGVKQGAASASPYMARPAYPAADVSMYNRRPPASPVGLSSLVANAQEDQEAMLNPGFRQRLMEAENQGTPTSLQGIDIGEPAPAMNNPDLSSDEGLQAAGLMPSDPLPVTPPRKPLEETDKEFSPVQVEQAQNVINTLANSNPAPEGMAGATRAKDQERINNDIMEVAKAKDPAQAWNELQKQPFYQKSSFYTGLMGVGLSIMSGKSPIEAFQIGSGLAAQDETKQQLEANRDALLEQGYSQDSVAAAIASGDPSLLKMRQISPQEKMALAAQDEERANREWDRRQQIQENSMRERAAETRRAAEERADAQFAKQKELIEYRDKVKADRAEQAAQSFNFSTKELRNVQNTAEGSVAKQWAEKAALFKQSHKDLDLADQAIKDKDYQSARTAYMQAIMNSARAEIGANRSLQADDLAHFAEDPSIFVKVGNTWSLKAGYRPSDAALSYARKQATVGASSADKGVLESKKSTIDAYVGSGMNKKRATALVNRGIPSGGFYDPYKTFDAEAEESVGGDATNPRLTGALSSSATDTSWMLQ